MRINSELRYQRLILLAGASFILQLQPAAAQETVLQTITIEAESDDILVQDGYVAKSDRIGTKTDTPLARIPQAISVVTQDQIEDQRPRTLNEALSYTAGANPNSFGFDSRYDAFYLRGFPAYYTGIFRDGLRQYNGPSAWFKTEPYGIEGLTVLKGPASSLYGVSGPGGLVNIVTKRPKDVPFREVEVGIGQHDRYQAAFDFSGPVNEEETFLYRLTALGRKSDTHLDGYSDDKAYIAPAFTWKPDEDTRLTLLGEYSKSVTGSTAFFHNPSLGKLSNVYSGDPEWNDFDSRQFRVGYEFEHRFNDTVSARQNVRYSKVDADLKYNGFCTHPDELTYYGCQYPDRMWGHYKETIDNLAIDNVLQFEFDLGEVQHTAIAGFDYGWSDYNAYSASSYVSVEDIKLASPGFVGGQRVNQYGIYLQDQLEWNSWTLVLSGRHDWIDTKSVDWASIKSDQSDNAFSGRLGLSYRTDWGLTPYANYSTSFSPNMGFVHDYDGTRSVAKPTKGEQFEIGVKYEIPEANAVLSAAFFNIDQTDGVVFDGTFDTAGNQIQRQLDLNSRGLELEANASFDNGFSLIASYTYMRMKIEKGATGTVGNELSATPNHIASLWGHYLVENGPLAGLGLGGGLRYVGESYGDDANSFKNEDRVFVDAAVSYNFGYSNPDLEGLMLQVNAKNVFDAQKPTCSAGNCYWEEGRSVYASLRYRF